VFHTKQSHAGVLLLRMESASGAMKAHALRTLFSNYARYMKRKFCVFSNDKLRIRS